MSLLLATTLAGLTPVQETALNVGLIFAGLFAILSLVLMVLNIASHFRSKEAYATKGELQELRREMKAELSGIEANLKALTSSIQTGFTDLSHAIGVLEGKSGR